MPESKESAAREAGTHPYERWWGFLAHPLWMILWMPVVLGILVTLLLVTCASVARQAKDARDSAAHSQPVAAPDK